MSQVAGRGLVMAGAYGRGVAAIAAWLVIESSR